MISSTRGFLPQSEKYDRFMAGESLKKYVQLHRGEFAYNKGNSKTYPQGCIFRLDDWKTAAIPNVYFSFKVDPTVVDSNFISQYFAAGSLNGQLKRVITSGARANGLLNLSPDDFFGCIVTLPPLPEQRRIAEILGSVDEAIRATEAVIEQTRRVKEGLLQELLTKGIGHTRFKKTPIGEIPEGWEVKRLDSMTTSLDSKRVPLKAANRAERQGGFRYYGASGVIDYIDDYIFEGENLLVAEDGFNLLNRRTPIAFVVDGKYWVNNHAHVLGPAGQNDLNFIAACFERLDIRPYLTGFDMPKLNAKALATIKLPLPRPIEQREISLRIKSVDNQIDALERSAAQARQLKQGLLQDLLTGKVRVSV